MYASSLLSCVNSYQWPLFSGAVCGIFIVICAVFWFADNSTKNTEKYKAVYDEKGKLRRCLGFAVEKHVLNMGHFGCLVASALNLKSRVPLRADLVLQALKLLSKRYPLLRMRISSELSPDSKSTEDYFVEREDPNRVDFQERPEISADDWLSVLNIETHHGFDLNVGPLWRAILLREEIGSTTNTGGKYNNSVIFTFNHAICDGLSIMAFYEQFLSYLNRLQSEEDITVDSLPLLPPLSYLMKHRVTLKTWEKVYFSVFYGAKSWLQNMFFPSSKPDPFLAVYPPLSRDPALPKIAVIIPRSLSVEETAQLASSCKAQGCTVHGAVTAAAALAVAEMIRRKSKAPVPALQTSYDVNVRRNCSPEVEPQQFGCYISGCCPLTIPPIKSTVEFLELAKECSYEVKRFISQEKHLHRLKITSNVGHDVTFPRDEGTGRFQNVFNVSNCGRFEIGKDKDWVHVFNAMYYTSSVSNNGPTLGNNVVSVNGKLCWSFVYYTNITTHAIATEVADMTINTLKQLVLQGLYERLSR